MIPIKKPVRRSTLYPFLHYRKRIVVELLPGDVIRLRLLKQRESSAVSIEISRLYYELVKRRALARKAERRKQRKQRKP